MAWAASERGTIGCSVLMADKEVPLPWRFGGGEQRYSCSMRHSIPRLVSPYSLPPVPRRGLSQPLQLSIRVNRPLSPLIPYPTLVDGEK
jgi:hypothetical protein